MWRGILTVVEWQDLFLVLQAPPFCRGHHTQLLWPRHPQRYLLVCGYTKLLFKTRIVKMIICCLKKCTVGLHGAVTIFLSNHVFMQILKKRVQAVFVYESLSYVKLTRHGFKWSCCKYTRDLFSILYRRKTESSESKTIRRSFILLAALYLKSAESA